MSISSAVEVESNMSYIEYSSPSSGSKNLFATCSRFSSFMHYKFFFFSAKVLSKLFKLPFKLLRESSSYLMVCLLSSRIPKFVSLLSRASSICILSSKFSECEFWRESYRSVRRISSGSDRFI